MHVKKYRAATMQLALERVRADLGGDAVILNTRTVERGGLFRLLRRPMVEIYASADVTARPRMPRPPASTGGTEPPRTMAGPAPRELLDELEGLRKQIDALVSERADSVTFPTPLRSYYTQLIDRGVHAAVARRYLREIHDQFSAADHADALKVRLQLIDFMKTDLRVHGPFALRHDRPTVMAAVGPTGVGKTTTIAKLAAYYAITERRRVGLITVDTYRIAAVEQLRVYAEIMGLPLEVAMTPAELKAGLQRLHEMDVVLMDTAGRSPHDATKLHELEAMLAAAKPDHTVLCLSSTTQVDEIPGIVERFAVAPLTSVILTKVDETLRPGWILNACSSVQLPLVYLTTGQNVPDDIELAEATRLVSRILGEEGGA